MRAELDAYGGGLAEKPEIVALNKADALPEKERRDAVKALAKAAGATPLVLSAASGEGVDTALRLLVRTIAASKSADPNKVPAEKEEAWKP